MHTCNQNRFGRLYVRIQAFVGIAILLASAGCGGGGGGSASSVTVTGTVLSAETSLPPTAAATVKIGGRTATTASDGTFSLAGVPLTVTTGTVAATGEITRTLTFKLTATTTQNPTDSLGNIYLSTAGYTAVATGTVVTLTNGQSKPVAGAAVIISGNSTTTAADGTFTVSNLPVGLGVDPNTPIGTITATGYAVKPIYTQFVLTAPTTAAPTNPLGTFQLGAPIGTTPVPPYTIYGSVQHNTTGQPGVTVTLTGPNGSITTTTDSNGNYYFWVVPGTYTASAVNAGGHQVTVSVTLDTTNTPKAEPIINI